MSQLRLISAESNPSAMKVGMILVYKAPLMKTNSFLCGWTVVAFTLWLGSVSAQSQTVYCVRAGAAGSGDGSDWNNAIRSLPSALIRGRINYVAPGNYGAYSFTSPDHGS